MSETEIQLATKEELLTRLRRLIPAEEIDREKVFYLHGLMYFTKENAGTMTKKDICMFLQMTLGANLIEPPSPLRPHIPLEKVIEAIVGPDYKSEGDEIRTMILNIGEKINGIFPLHLN